MINGQTEGHNASLPPQQIEFAPSDGFGARLRLMGERAQISKDLKPNQF